LEIIFWNVNNNKAAIDIITKSDFVSSERLIAFAEYWEISDYISAQLSGKHFWIDDVKKRTGFVHSGLNLELKLAERYYTKLSIDYRDIKVHTWIVHLKSKLNSESVSISQNAEIMRGITREINENSLKHVLIIGDFNTAHFDTSMFEFYHLNSTNYFTDDDLAEKKFDGQERIKFYNPIGALSGDLAKGPPGTYYYNLPNQSQAWHTYDIALVSYSLSLHLDKQSCEIVTDLNGHTLNQANGRPFAKISDHFPIRIRFS